MLLGCLGAGLGLCVTEWLSLHTLGTTDPWFLAPMGASAVLLFAVPASPLAQPWSILGGNTVSALVGVSCALLLGHTGLAASAAGALAIAAMFALRCLHPPGGAVAVTAVMGGQAVTHGARRRLRVGRVGVLAGRLGDGLDLLLERGDANLRGSLGSSHSLFDLDRTGSDRRDSVLLLRLLVLGGDVERLRALGAVTVDGDGLQALAPALDVGLGDIVHCGVVRQVDGL